LEDLYRLRDQKVVRFIGITSHCDPATLAQALARHDFDCTQMALNAGLQGRCSATIRLPG
jgi:predicted aldo/keto reductase-like oxidoreductase